MSPRLEVSQGFCLVTGATPGPAQPKERHSCHPTLDCEPGLNTLPGRAATLSQAKETDGSGCVKAMALFPLRERKTQVLLPGCSMDLGAQSPIPAQPHQQGPVSWQRQQLLDKDQLQPHRWLGWFPSQSPEQTTGPTRQSSGPQELCVLVCVTAPQSHEEEGTHHSQALISLLSHPHPYSTSAGLHWFLPLHWQNSTHETLSAIIPPCHKSPHLSLSLLAAHKSEFQTHSSLSCGAALSNSHTLQPAGAPPFIPPAVSGV